MEKKNRIAITCEAPDLDAPIDPRFGRAAGFLIVEPDTLDFEYADNGSSQAMAQGAGIQAAENVSKTGVKTVLTGYVGPKAFMALNAAGIRVGQNLEGLTVRQAIDKYNTGTVEFASGPSKNGHWR